MPKIENFATHVKVNGNPYAKNALNYQIQSGDTVGLYYTNDRDRRILEKTLARFDDWTDLNDTPYTSFNTLITDLDEFLFSNDVTQSDASDFLAIAAGRVSGKYTVNKFGSAPSGIQTTATDIWSRADAASTQQVWLAPTAARIHTIASTSAADNTAGTGCNQVIVSYLADWDTKEQIETITGNLNGGVVMTNAAVMIHRIKCIPQSTTTAVGINVGTITATAAVDGTITAVVLPGDGQTEMAIYGVPSTQDVYLKRWGVSIDKAQGTAVSVDFRIRLNPNPDVQTVAFQRKQDLSLQSTGASAFEKIYDVPPKYPGPCIIKVEALGSANDIDGQSDFDLIVEDKL